MGVRSLRAVIGEIGGGEEVNSLACCKESVANPGEGDRRKSR